jgi:hypothetical protein
MVILHHHLLVNYKLKKNYFFFHQELFDFVVGDDDILPSSRIFPNNSGEFGDFDKILEKENFSRNWDDTEEIGFGPVIGIAGD